MNRLNLKNFLELYGDFTVRRSHTTDDGVSEYDNLWPNTSHELYVCVDSMNFYESDVVVSVRNLAIKSSAVFDDNGNHVAGYDHAWEEMYGSD